MKILRTTIILYACEYAHEFISHADLTLCKSELFTVFTVKIRQGSGTLAQENHNKNHFTFTRRRRGGLN